MKAKKVTRKAQRVVTRRVGAPVNMCEEQLGFWFDIESEAEVVAKFPRLRDHMWSNQMADKMADSPELRAMFYVAESLYDHLGKRLAKMSRVQKLLNQVTA